MSKSPANPTAPVVVKPAEVPSRFLIATPNQQIRDLVTNSLSQFIAGAEFSYASDGSEALFKLSNATFQIVFFDKDLPKRSGLQITELLATQEKLEKTAVVLMSEMPSAERFVDDVVIGRVQFVPDVQNTAGFERAVSRALNYISHGDQAQFHMKFLATGEILMRQGDAATHVYLVKKGKLKAVLKNADGPHVLGFVDVGEFVGEMAYINGEPRLADVEAETPCELIEIPIAHLDHLLFQRPAWSKALMKTLSKRLKVRDLSKKD